MICSRLVWSVREAIRRRIGEKIPTIPVARFLRRDSFGTFTFNPEAVATSQGHFVQSFQSGLSVAQLLQPGKHCSDKNHAGEREDECTKEAK